MSGRIPKVVVIGSVYVDMAVKCSDFPGPGETVDGTGFSCIPTGPGLNRAVEAAHCGCETYLMSKVGDDHFGKSIRENVSGHGVNCDFLYTAQAISTGIIVTLANSLGENSSCISAGANRALSPDEIACASAEQLIGSADVCLIHDDLPGDVVITAIRMANLYSTKVVLEAQLAIDNAGKLKDTDWPMEYYSVNILVPHFDNAGGASRFEMPETSSSASPVVTLAENPPLSKPFLFSAKLLGAQCFNTISKAPRNSPLPLLETFANFCF